MPSHPHYHSCPGCQFPVLCTKSGDHDDRPVCFTCRKPVKVETGYQRDHGWSSARTHP